MAMRVLVGLTETKDQAVIEIQEDERGLAHVIFDGPELEGLIRAMAKIRDQLPEKVSPELDPGARIEVISEPAWRIPDTHTGPSSHAVIALRHPGYGWIGFLLEKSRSRQIGEALIAAVED